MLILLLSALAQAMPVHYLPDGPVDERAARLDGDRRVLGTPTTFSFLSHRPLGASLLELRRQNRPGEVLKAEDFQIVDHAGVALRTEAIRSCASPRWAGTLEVTGDETCFILRLRGDDAGSLTPHEGRLDRLELVERVEGEELRSRWVEEESLGLRPPMPWTWGLEYGGSYSQHADFRWGLLLQRQLTPAVGAVIIPTVELPWDGPVTPSVAGLLQTSAPVFRARGGEGALLAAGGYRWSPSSSYPNGVEVRLGVALPDPWSPRHFETPRSSVYLAMDHDCTQLLGTDCVQRWLFGAQIGAPGGLRKANLARASALEERARGFERDSGPVDAERQ